jgi:class 3 adenylate cyclase
MHCPKCAEENPAQARFCLQCGARLSLLCPQCHTELPPDAQFCLACGAQVAAAPPQLHGMTAAEHLERLAPKEYVERLLAARGHASGERRTVTILFADVKGSTSIAEKLDPEDVAEVMNGAFEVLMPPVYRYEGTLARLMGDAILALFGAPIAHEDDPERACRAGLEITAEAQRYAEKLERERGIQGFNVRVGINTGLVVVGEVGTDLRVEYTAMGDAVNLAARMESAAQPGTVLATESTFKLVAPLFETTVLGPLRVKGKAEPVLAYRVVAAKPARGKIRGIAGLESPLVGREAEFHALQEALQCLRSGVGGVVTIVGEAGLGKSRLMAECRTDCKSGLRWVEGRCLSYGTSIAYLLWLDVLRNLLGVTVDDSPQQVRDRLHERVSALCGEAADCHFPYLAHLMSLPLDAETESRLRDEDGQQLKGSTFEAVEALLRCAANDRPLVLVCEDLHWADRTSLELLERIVTVTDCAPLLLLCVFRPDPEHGSWQLRETIRRSQRQRYTDLELRLLCAAESQTLLDNLLGVDALPIELRQRIAGAGRGQSLLRRGSHPWADGQRSHLPGPGDRPLGGHAQGGGYGHPRHAAGSAAGTPGPAGGRHQARPADGGGDRADVLVPRAGRHRR